MQLNYHTLPAIDLRRIDDAGFKPCLSIILPARNEERRITSCLRTIAVWRQANPISMEILLVINGTSDQTVKIATAANQDLCLPLFIHYSQPGKGAAIAEGMARARGRYWLLADVDWSMPINHVEHMLIGLYLGSAGLLIASREGHGAERINEPWQRHLAGRGFNLLTRLLLPELWRVPDTQCGFKMMTHWAGKDLLQAIKTPGWAFDLELLLAARKRGLGPVILPVTWQYDADTRVSIQTTWHMLQEVMAIRQRNQRGEYA